MRKVFIVFGIVATAGITFSTITLNQINVDKKSNSDRVQISNIVLSEENLKSIHRTINEKNVQSQFNDLIFDLSKSSSQVLTKDNAKEIITVANNNLAAFFDCFNRSGCGVADSVIKTMIARNLELIKVALKINIGLSKNVNWIVVRECSGLNVENIEVLSLDLLRNYNTQNNGDQKILDIASSYSGKDKVDFFMKTAETLTSDERKMFVSALKDSFNKDDPKTVELVAEEIGKFGLEKFEIADLEKSLCRFKASESWNKIKNSMSLVSPGLENTCN